MLILLLYKYSSFVNIGLHVLLSKSEVAYRFPEHLPLVSNDYVKGLELHWKGFICEFSLIEESVIFSAAHSDYRPHPSSESPFCLLASQYGKGKPVEFSSQFFRPNPASLKH